MTIGAIVPRLDSWSTLPGGSSHLFYSADRSSDSFGFCGAGFCGAGFCGAGFCGACFVVPGFVVPVLWCLFCGACFVVPVTCRLSPACCHLPIDKPQPEWDIDSQCRSL